MRREFAVFAAVLMLGGCAAQRESYLAQRDAPDLAFKGPLRPVSLSAGQIKQAQKAIAQALTGQQSPSFGKSYRAGQNADGQTVLCGYVDGKRFAGMFAKATRGPAQFLPIGIGIDEQEADSVKQYCRDNGIYVPQ